MQVQDYDRFYVASPEFFDSPDMLADSASRLELATCRVPSGWQREEADFWVRMTPDTRTVPEEGFMVHISVMPEQVPGATELIWDYCISRQIPFDFVRSFAAACYLNGPNGDRETCGRLITVYLPGEIESSLAELDVLFGDFHGPDVWGSLHRGAGPLFIRYGAFGAQTCLNSAGNRVPALRSPDGILVPEPDRPMFSLPKWIQIPSALERDLAALRSQAPQDFPYQIKRALSHRVGSSIYIATRKIDGLTVILKEACAYAGLDSRGQDAVARLDREKAALERMADTGCVPQVVDRHEFGRHHFLAIERVAGAPLQGAGRTMGHPILTPETTQVGEFVEWLEGNLERVAQSLRRLTERGLRLGALDPLDVWIQSDGSAVLANLETVTDLADDSAPEVGERQYRVPAGLSSGEAHAYMVDYLRLSLMWLMSFHHPSIRRRLCDAAELHFGLMPGTGTVMADRLQAPPYDPDSDVVGPLLEADALDWSEIRDSIVQGILATATPERADRLFPCAPLSRTDIGGFGLSHGAAGVLYALHGAGVAVPEEFVTWLMNSVERGGAPRAGVHAGLHGVAYTLLALGHSEQALDLVDRCRSIEGQTLSANLAEGSAGVALTLLDFAQAFGDKGLHQRAVRLGSELEKRILDGPLPARKGEYPPYGLLHGASGLGLFFLRLYESTTDPHYLDVADRAIQYDLARCVLRPDGSAMLDDGELHQPYLHGGSYGVAFVLHNYLAHRPDDTKAAWLSATLKACHPLHMANTGLLRGRAGAIATLAALDKQRGRTMIEGQIRQLAWYAQTYRGHLAFPGLRMQRLSTDLATGSAGVLLALSSAFEGTVPVLPYLDGGWIPSIHRRR